MQPGRFPIERNGARKKPQASTPKSTLDNAVVVIEGMTRIKDLSGAPFDFAQGMLKLRPFNNAGKELFSSL
jgi:hypothetical protein